MSKRTIKSFNEINQYDRRQVGGKGLSLGEMYNWGIAVPKGFVITTEVFECFLKNAELGLKIKRILYDCNFASISNIEEVAIQIKTLINNSDIPSQIVKEIFLEFENLKLRNVAVRSSAVAEDSVESSWAGELESFLYISKDQLLENIKNCWISFFSVRSLIYQWKKGLPIGDMKIAVIVQEMIQPETSGLCFTVNPVNNQKDELVIEAAYGLGDVIASGIITPDIYVLSKDSGNIIKNHIASQKYKYIKDSGGEIMKENIPMSFWEKPKLTKNQLSEILERCCQIEQYYKFPQDIEWAYSEGKLFVLQSRPITTLDISLKE